MDSSGYPEIDLIPGQGVSVSQQTILKGKTSPFSKVSDRSLKDQHPPVFKGPFFKNLSFKIGRALIRIPLGEIMAIDQGWLGSSRGREGEIGVASQTSTNHT